MYKVTLYDRSAYPGGGQVLLDTSSGTNPGLQQAVCETKLNAAGSFSYSIVPEHSLYGMTEPIDRYVSVEEDGFEIFWGRIISVQTNRINGIKQVTCEGALSFFKDIEIGGDAEETELTAEQYFRICVNAFNSGIGNDPARRMQVGIIDIDDKDETARYRQQNYQDIESVMKSKLIEQHDGFLRVRRVGTEHYIDWVAVYGNVNPQEIRITQNVTQHNITESGEDIFTVIRPVGKDQMILDGYPRGAVPISDEMVAEHGIIERSVTFGDVETQEELLAKTLAIIQRLDERLSISGDIGFVDFHFINGQGVPVRVGDIFTNIDGFEGEPRTAETVSRDLLNPANDRLTLKTDKELANSLSSVGANRSSESTGGMSSGGRFSGGGAAALKYYHEGQDAAWISVRNFEISTEENFRVHSRAISLNAENIENNTADITELDTGWRNFQGTGIYQNKEFIANLAGKYSIDQNGDVHLQEGTEFIMTKDGASTRVLSEIKRVRNASDAANAWIDQYKGTEIYQSRDHIAQVAGVYSVHDYTDEQGHKHRDLIVEEGSKLYQDDSSGRFALYHEGNLTAGVMFRKMNNGGTESALLGDRIFIGSAQDYENLNSWASDTDSGLVAVRARIQTLETDAITTATLDAAISDLDIVHVKTIQPASGATNANLSLHSVSAWNRLYIGSGQNQLDLISNGVSDAVIDLDVTLSGNTYTLKKKTIASHASWTDVVTFSRATTLSGEYGGDNTGDTATYKVTATPQGSEITGSFKVKENKNAAWIEDANGAIRARIDNPEWNNGGKTAAIASVTATSGKTASMVLGFGTQYLITPKYTNKSGSAVNTGNTYVIQSPAFPSVTLDCDSVGDEDYDVAGNVYAKANGSTKATKQITVTKGSIKDNGKMAMNAYCDGTRVNRTWATFSAAKLYADHYDSSTRRYYFYSTLNITSGNRMVFW